MIEVLEVVFGAGCVLIGFVLIGLCAGTGPGSRGAQIMHDVLVEEEKEGEER